MKKSGKSSRAQQLAHLVSVFARRNVIPILAEDGKIGLYNFSMSKDAKQLFNRVRNLTQVVTVYMYSKDLKSGNSRSVKLGAIPYSKISDFEKCNGAFNYGITLEEYKILYRLDNNEKINKHLREIGIVGEKNPIIPKNLEALIDVLNDECRFKYYVEEKTVGVESGLYSIFNRFIEKLYLDFFINNIILYLGAGGFSMSQYSSEYYKNFSSVIFNELERDVFNKEAFVAELLKCVQIKLFGYVDESNITGYDNSISMGSLYAYAKYNLERISSVQVIAENLKFPEKCASKKIGVNGDFKSGN